MTEADAPEIRLLLDKHYCKDYFKFCARIAFVLNISFPRMKTSNIPGHPVDTEVGDEKMTI